MQEPLQSENVWDDNSPAARFMRRLVRERAIEFMRSPGYLKKLRFDYDRAKADQKLFGHVWAEYGVNVFQLIATRRTRRSTARKKKPQ